MKYLKHIGNRVESGHAIVLFQDDNKRLYVEHQLDGVAVTSRASSRYAFDRMTCDVPEGSDELIYLLYTLFGVSLMPESQQSSVSPQT